MASSPVATSKQKQQLRKICLQRMRRCCASGFVSHCSRAMSSAHMKRAAWQGSSGLTRFKEPLCSIIGQSALSTKTVIMFGKWVGSLPSPKINLPSSTTRSRRMGTPGVGESITFCQKKLPPQMYFPSRFRAIAASLLSNTACHALQIKHILFCWG